MRSFSFRLASLLLLAVTLAACATPQGVTAVQILGGERDLEVGASTQLAALVTAAPGVSTDVTWSSDAEGVATVDATGRVTATGPGAATITAVSAADATKSGSAAITVEHEPGTEGTFDATYQAPPDLPAGVSAAMFLLDESVLGPAAVTEIMEGLYMGPSSLIGDDGSLKIKLPAGADLPASVMRGADSMVAQVEGAECELAASDAGVQVTRLYFELVSFPGVIVNTIGGAALALVVTAPIDFDAPDLLELYTSGFLTWAYAEAPVTVATVDEGCTMLELPLDVDVTLEQGWNQLVWTVDFDEATDTTTGLNLRNSDAETIYVIPTGSLPTF